MTVREILLNALEKRADIDYGIISIFVTYSPTSKSERFEYGNIIFHSLLIPT